MKQTNPEARIRKLHANGRRDKFVRAALRYNAHIVKMTQDYGHLRNKPNSWHQAFYDRYWLVNFWADEFVEDARIFLKRNLFGLAFDDEIVLYIRKTSVGAVFPGYGAREEGTTIREVRQSSGAVVAKTRSQYLQLAIDGLGLDDTVLWIDEPFAGFYPIRMEYRLFNGLIIRLDFIDQDYTKVIAVESLSVTTGYLGAEDGNPGQSPSPISPKPKKNNIDDDSLSKEG